MKRYFKYAAAAVSAATMVMSSVPAMAGSLPQKNDGAQKTESDHKVIIGGTEEKKTEEAKAEETKTTEETKKEETKTEEKKNSIVSKGSEPSHKVVVGGEADKKDATDKKDEKDKTDKTDKADKTDEADKTDKTDKTDEADKTDKNDEQAETVGYTALTGKINEVTLNEDGSARISFESTERGEIIFNEGADCMIIVGNEVKTIKELAAGMEATVVMEDNAPMTMSLPPQTSGAVAIVAQGETPSFVAVDKFDDELTSAGLKLNMDDTVKILDIRGTKQVLTAEDVKGQKAIVVYGASTKSIPAQTTPYMVIVLPETETEAPADKKEAPSETPENLPLRAAVEALGYTIEWTSNDEPIILVKGDKKAEIMVNSDTITIDGDMVHELSSAVIITDGVTYIPSDAVELLK
ncbi:MAG: copper amine oxidase N-terminal domain-containing protein [Candidatus Metalachnospira sp.]|nr:copper amine oxidase N-terminal domain-containing protein [Candidatus Metalachnospira sp.]